MGKRENPLHWMPFSVDFWLGELAGAMRADQKGALMDLLSIAWQQQPPCTLPDDDTFLAARSGLGAKWKASRPVVLARFAATDDGRLSCEWLRAVYDEQFTKYTNRSTANRNNRRGTKRPTNGATNRDTNGDTNRVQRVEGALPLQGKEPLPAEPAPAPEGAAPPAGSNGNYLASPGAVEALLRRGVRIEQIDRTPHGTLAELTNQQEWRRIEYDAELDRSVAGWMAMNPDATAELEREARSGFRPGELSPTARDALRAAVVELIRQREKWPTLDAWDGCEFGVVAVMA